MSALHRRRVRAAIPVEVITRCAAYRIRAGNSWTLWFVQKAEALIRPKTCGQAFVTAFAIATVLVAPCAANLAVAGGVARYARGVPTARAADHGSFANYNPVHGYYTHHDQYVPGAGDRLIYGPGYVFVPGRGILGKDCAMPTSTCANEYRDIR